MLSNSLKLACLTAGVATAWTLADTQKAEASFVLTPVVLTLDPTASLSNVYLVYGFNDSGYIAQGEVAFPGPFPANTVTTQTEDAIDFFSGEPYSVLANYQLALDPVTVGLTNSAASTLLASPEPFDTYFSPTGYTELSVGGYLSSGDTGSIGSFWSAVNNAGLGLDIPFGSGGTLVNFSDSYNGGTFIATTPEPAPLGLLVAGFGLAILRRRRKISS
ncbi:MAG TPA: PEP-CTERM sorting domain-containing protein [Phycisphaerae bacterium]|nr:PEP-CTERM sorting domain-containing protein [Phycisphaerae bacterium]